jgi:hypothetical protein
MHDLLIAALANWARKQTRGTGCRIRHCVYGSILGVQSRPTIRLCSRYVQYRPRAQRHRGTETRGRIRNVGEALTGPASTSQARGEFNLALKSVQSLSPPHTGTSETEWTAPYLQLGSSGRARGKLRPSLLSWVSTIKHPIVRTVSHTSSEDRTPTERRCHVDGSY